MPLSQVRSMRAGAGMSLWMSYSARAVAGAVYNWVKAYREGGMAGCDSGTGTPRRAASPRPPAAGRPPSTMTMPRLCAAGSRNWSWRTR